MNDISEKLIKLSVSVVLLGVATPTMLHADRLTTVKYLMHAVPTAIEMPMFYAKDKGLFEQEGLDVDLLPGRSSQDSVNALVAGSAFIASAQGSSVIQGAVRGQPVVMVASRYGTNPSALFTSEDIKSLKRLSGKQVAVPFSTLEKLIRAILKHQGADPATNQYVLIPQLPAMVNTFAEGKVDSVITTAPFGRAIIGNRRTKNEFLLAGYGVTDPGYVLITSQKNLDEHPDLLRHFLRAVYRAYELVDENMDEAAQITSKHLEKANVDFIKEYYAQYAAFACSKEQLGKPRGYVPVIGLKDASDLFLEAGIISEPIDVNKIATNRFFEGDQALRGTAMCSGK